MTTCSGGRSAGRVVGREEVLLVRQADGWVLRPNRAFAGQTPLARMTAGDVTDLAAVRAYVDAARAPWS